MYLHMCKLNYCAPRGEQPPTWHAMNSNLKRKGKSNVRVKGYSSQHGTMVHLTIVLNQSNNSIYFDFRFEPIISIGTVSANVDKMSPDQE